MKTVSTLFVTTFCLLWLGGFQAFSQNKKKATQVPDLTPLQKREINEELRTTTDSTRKGLLRKALDLKIPLRFYAPEGSMILNGFQGDLPIYESNLNAGGANLIKTSRLLKNGGIGLELDGQGIRMGIWELGKPRETHKSLTPRVTKHDAAAQDITNENGHATHVAGTMISSGVGTTDASQENAKGMAPNGSLRSYNVVSDVNEQAAEAKQGMLVSNHSYGKLSGWKYTSAYNNGVGPKRWCWYGDTTISNTQDFTLGFYGAKSYAWDTLAYKNPDYLICKAAGNDQNMAPPAANTDPKYKLVGGVWKPLGTWNNKKNQNAAGFDCIEFSATAKNILTVGATEDALNYIGPGTIDKAPFSSVGPTDDGRIKPDVVAKGMGVFSTYSTNDEAFYTANGTSMATPMVSGTVALLQQLYKKHNFDVAMKSSSMKALLIHTAEEMGDHPGPDYFFGHGLVNAQKAAHTILGKGLQSQILEKRLLNTKKDTIRIQGIPNPDGFKATLVWTDLAGTVVANQLNPPGARLVNDLDVRIVLPGNVTVLPWKLDPANPTNAATKADNTRDNVEVVHHPAGAAGEILVIVSHKGNIGAGQDYSLIVTGFGLPVAVVDPVIPILTPNETFISLVKLSNLNNATSGTAYHSDFSYLFSDICSGKTYPLSVTVKDIDNMVNKNKTVKVWIDWNGNGNFNEVGEMVLQTANFIVGNANNTITGNITAPAFVGPAQSKNIRMRVVMRTAEDMETHAVALGKTLADASDGAGEVEDYTIRFNNSGHTTTISSAQANSLVGIHNNLIIANQGVATIGVGLEVRCKCEVQAGGKLHLFGFGLLGSADFELKDGGHLLVRNNEGIGADASTGGLRTSGARMLSKKGNYEFEVTTGITGAGLPDTVNELIVSSLPEPNNLSLTKGVKILNRLKIKTGMLDLNGKPLVLVARKEGHGGGGLQGPKTARLDTMKAGCKILGNTFTQEQWIGAGVPAWYFFGSPLKNSTLNTWAPTAPITGIPGGPGGGKNVKFYHEPNTPIANAEENGYYFPGNINDATPPGKGMVLYLYPNFFNGDRKVKLTGEPNYVNLPGTFDFPITFTPATGYGGGGFNLVANPFPSEIDWNSANGWTKTNVDGAVWVWKKDKYASWVGGVGVNGGSNKIAAMQGFFVKANAANPVLKCTEEVKPANSHSSPAFLRIATDPTLVRLTLKQSQTDQDECVLRFEPGTSKSFDPNFDAAKMWNAGFNMALGPLPGFTLAISTQSLPLAQPDTISLAIFVPGPGQYGLKVSEIPAALEGKLALLDLSQNTLILLESGLEVPLSIGAALGQQGGDRWKIIIAPQNVTQVANFIEEKPSITLFPNPARESFQIQIRGHKAPSAEIRLINSLGKEVYKAAYPVRQGTHTLVVPRPKVAAGMYRMEVSTAGAEPMQTALLLE
jgi:hypothetical protein